MIVNRIKLLFGCLLTSILSVVLMYLYSLGYSERPNSFVRKLPPHLITPANIVDLNNPFCYLIGKMGDHIFLGDYYKPNSIISLNNKTADSSIIYINFSRETLLLKGVFNLIHDSTVFVLDGNQPALYTGKFLEQNTLKSFHPPFFNCAISISKSSLIFRSVVKNENVLLKYRMDSLGFRFSDKLLKKQVDGIFCTDGNLVNIPNTSRFFYVYYYRNQFLCIDSNLQLTYQAKTIDTNYHAKIKVSHIKLLSQSSLSAPPAFVNKQCTANEKYLFITSALKADNESSKMLKNLSTIDVYAVSDGKYQFSFYLPDFRGFKVRDFKVYGQSLYALYDHYLYKYQLNF